MQLGQKHVTFLSYHVWKLLGYDIKQNLHNRIITQLKFLSWNSTHKITEELKGRCMCIEEDFIACIFKRRFFNGIYYLHIGSNRGLCNFKCISLFIQTLQTVQWSTCHSSMKNFSDSNVFPINKVITEHCIL